MADDDARLARDNKSFHLDYQDKSFHFDYQDKSFHDDHERVPMIAQNLAEAYAGAAHRLVGDLDVAGNLTHLLADCAALMGAEAAGLLARGSHDGLELVSSTSHRAAELELYELQHDTGPCVEAVRSGLVVTARISDHDERGADFRGVMAAAGLRSASAFPVLWHRDLIGAVNVFHVADVDLTRDLRQTGQAFATMAALVLAQPSDLSTAQIEHRVLETLESRAVVERAKGVVAYRQGIDMESAFRWLIRVAAQEQRSVTDVAARTVAGVPRLSGDAP